MVIVTEWLLPMVGVAILTLIIALGAHAELQTREGLQPYTPSKIEWLRMELNAEGKEELSENPGYSKHFTYDSRDPNTVIIFVRYFPHTDRQLLNQVVNNARQIIELKAKKRGWDWVRIGESVQIVK